MGTQQHPDIFKVLCAARLIDERLELETDQSLGAYHADPAQTGLKLCSIGKKASRNGSAGVKEVQTLVASCVIGRIGTAMNAAITQS